MIGMTTTLELRGATALVTGASSGIGESMAEEFARRGSDLVLVARSAERLANVADRVRQRFGVSVTILVADLVNATERLGVIEACADRKIDVLVNNAGVGLQGNFADLGSEPQVSMVELNCAAVVAMSAAFVPGMMQRRAGGVLNVARSAPFQPIPTMATYAATKAFVLSFSYALREELRPHGVHVLALCPGPVATYFSRGFSDRLVSDRFFAHAPSPDAIVRKAVGRFVAGRSSSLAGPGAYAAAFASRALPRDLVTGAIGRL